MKCRYCDVVLAPLRSLTDGEFCCDDHREAFHDLGADIVRFSSVPPVDSLIRLHVALSGASADIPAVSPSNSKPQDFQSEVIRTAPFNVQTKTSDGHAGLPAADRLLPLKVTQTAAECHDVAPISAPTEGVFPGRTIFPRNTAR